MVNKERKRGWSSGQSYDHLSILVKKTTHPTPPPPFPPFPFMPPHPGLKQKKPEQKEEHGMV